MSWSDEFEGDALDPSSWNVVTGADVGCCRDALCTSSNVAVANGTLILTSKAEATGQYNYTTGAVTTEGKRHWSYSPRFRLCASAILPGYVAGQPLAGTGLWPALWMMGDAPSCDPDLGEPDLLEMIDGNGVAYATYHWQTTYPKQNCTYPVGHESVHAQVQMPADWGTAFHEYAVERGETYLAYVYDSKVILNVSTTDPAHPMFWPVPFYFLANTAIGGSWPGPVNASTVFPAYHILDYVRVVTANN